MTSLHRGILITGGTGLLGLNWAQAVKDRFRVTLGLHRRRSIPPGTNGVDLSLGDVGKLTAALETLKAELVVHAVGLTSVEACEADPQLARSVNVDMTAAIADACNRAGARLVHISTDHLFDGTRHLCSEEQLIKPLNVYARTKADAEKAALDGCPDALVVRTNFYGWGPSYRPSFSDWIISSLRSGTTVRLFDDVTITPILATELARSVHEIVEKGGTGVFNVTGDDAITKLDFGKSIAMAFDLDLGLIQSGKLADATGLVQRPFDMSLSNKKTCALLGRPLGGVNEHLRILKEQEHSVLTKELANL